MAAKIIPLRHTPLPENVFRMIEDFALGQLVGIHITAVTQDGRVVCTSAGAIPGAIKSLDSRDYAAAG